MHMADALLSPAVGGGFWAASTVALTIGARKVRARLDDRLVPLMGVLGAFVFAAQMVNFTIPGTGSSGHLGGGMLLAVLLGSFPAMLVMASILAIQALFFADGGLLALGANIWNLGVYPCLVAYPLIFRPLTGRRPSARRTTLASMVSVACALQLGSFSVVAQTALSGIADLPFRSFLLVMQPIHLAIGVVEGLVTAGILNSIRVIEPARADSGPPAGGESGFGRMILVFAVLAMLTAGGISWLSSSNPDGLEWAVRKLRGTVDMPGGDDRLSRGAARVQEMTAILPGYSLPGVNEENGGTRGVTSREAGLTVSGLLGGLLVLGAVVVLGGGITFMRRRKRQASSET